MRHAPLLESLPCEDGVGKDRDEGVLLPRSERRASWREEPRGWRRPQAGSERCVRCKGRDFQNIDRFFTQGREARSRGSVCAARAQQKT